MEQTEHFDAAGPMEVFEGREMIMAKHRTRRVRGPERVILTVSKYSPSPMRMYAWPSSALLPLLDSDKELENKKGLTRTELHLECSRSSHLHL